MKRLFSIFLCTLVVLSLAGCKKPKTPQEIEQQITQELSNITYLDAQVAGTIAMQTGTASKMTVSVDTAYKLDDSGDFPVMSLNGTLGVEGIASMPVSFYMNENGGVLEALGQSTNFPIDDTIKAQMTGADNQTLPADINRSIAETTYNNQRAIQITYDTNALNNKLQYTEPVFNSFIVYYLIDEKDKLSNVVTTLAVSSVSFQADINLDIKINSLNEPITIEPITVTKQTVILGQDEL